MNEVSWLAPAIRHLIHSNSRSIAFIDSVLFDWIQTEDIQFNSSNWNKLNSMECNGGNGLCLISEFGSINWSRMIMITVIEWNKLQFSFMKSEGGIACFAAIYWMFGLFELNAVLARAINSTNNQQTFN